MAKNRPYAVMVLLLGLLLVFPVHAGRNFDGVDDEIQPPRHAGLEPTSAVTVALFFKRNGAQINWAYLAAKDVNNGTAVPYNTYWVGFEDTSGQDRLTCATGHTNNTQQLLRSTADTTNNTWYFVACTYDDATDQMRLWYATGNAALTLFSATNTRGALKVDTTDDFCIGAACNQASIVQEFNGIIAQVAVWKDVELTEA